MTEVSLKCADADLLANVAPPAWVNPAPADRYHLVALGGGSAGLVSAMIASGLGARVALVEKHRLGGDCLNYGCVPSKALLRSARAAFDACHAERFGVRFDAPPRLDFDSAMSRMRSVRASISRHDAAQRMASQGIDVYFGSARFIDSDVVEVDGRRLRFRRCVIATGARPLIPGIPGLADASPHTNETIFSLSQQPRHLVVIGGGAIGCELAQAFARFGSSVTIVEALDRLLPAEDADASARVLAQFEAEGITVHASAKVVRVEPAEESGNHRVFVERAGVESALQCDAILASVGRRPNVDDLDLDAAGVAYDRSGVIVDDKLRTSNSRIYAVGDICTAMKFTHVADAMARLAVRNALFPFGRSRMSSLVVPRCTYTDPEVGHVGMSRDQALQAGHDLITLTVDLADVDRAVLDGHMDGFVRAHVARRSGRILGATIVARHAGDIIGELALAVTRGLSLKDLSATIHPYPTAAESLRKLGDQYVRSKLTPRVRRAMSWYFRVGR